MPHKLYNVPFTVPISGVAVVLAESPEDAHDRLRVEFDGSGGEAVEVFTSWGACTLNAPDGNGAKIDITAIQDNTTDKAEYHPDFDAVDEESESESEGSSGEKR